MNGMKLEDMTKIAGGEGPQYTKGGISEDAKSELENTNDIIRIKRNKHPEQNGDGLVCMGYQFSGYIDAGFMGPKIG